MPQFIMKDKETPAFNKLDKFTQGYIEAAFFTEAHCDNPEMEEKGFNDLAPETLDRIRRDCKRFQSENAVSLAMLEAAGLKSDYDTLERAGHDFWLTRNGHGAGFWDGDWQEPYGELLTTASEAYGECDLYVGDDGLIYC